MVKGIKLYVINDRIDSYEDSKDFSPCAYLADLSLYALPSGILSQTSEDTWFFFQNFAITKGVFEQMLRKDYLPSCICEEADYFNMECAKEGGKECDLYSSLEHEMDIVDIEQFADVGNQHGFAMICIPQIYSNGKARQATKIPVSPLTKHIGPSLEQNVKLDLLTNYRKIPVPINLSQVLYEIDTKSDKK